MIKYKQGDIFSEDVEAIINTVNCVGVMGRGLALQYKNNFPNNFKIYANACKQNKVQPGKMFVTETEQLVNPKYIINFPTKRHWKGKSKIEDIESGLLDLVQIIKRHNIKSIAIPSLGSGLGGLDWNIIKKTIKHALINVQNIDIVIYEPLDDVSVVKNISKKVPKMTEGRAALIGLMNKYLEGMLDPFISLLEIHKLVYFMQEIGEPLKLDFKKAQYGPYAQNLRHVLNAIEGHFIDGYVDGGDAPHKQIKLIPGAIADANKYLEDKTKTKNNFTKVANLISGFETSFGLELLSTVHWTIKHDNVDSIDSLTSTIYNWNEGKKKFSKRQINIAKNILVKNNIQ